VCLLVHPQRSEAQVKPTSGKLAGVVNDIGGIPQMGATVEVASESTASALTFLTNTAGVFHGDRLSPGLYTVRVTLAGFLPTLQRHVRISSHLTTVVRIQLESIFASLDQLRRQPSAVPVETDDWRWVLRSASATRPILQWTESDDTLSAATSTDMSKLPPRARLEFTDGARQPGSVSNLPSAPTTAFAYDQKLGGSARLLLASEMNDDQDAPGGAIATVWLPTGSLANGPHSALVLREERLGPNGPTFHGVRLDQGGAVALGGHALLRYGGEYVQVGLGKSATSIRPRAELDTQVSENWHTALIFAAQPGSPVALESGANSDGALEAALNELDSLPPLLWRHGSPELQGGWHEEVSVERKLGSQGRLQVAAFHDDSSHVAVFGRGNQLPGDEYLQDYFSGGFAYDGGSSDTYGARIALREKLSENVEVTTVYSYAGALSPSDAAQGPLRDMLQTSMHSSLGANVSAKISRFGTKVDAGYKWVSGVSVSRTDSYGEMLFATGPFLHVGIRQSLPRFGLGHWEAVANCDNLLGQGYLPLNTQDGRSVVVSAFRTFRGGLSVQF
jgi:hypothetical protein